MLLFSLARRRPSTLLIVMVCPITSIVPDNRLQHRTNQNQQAELEKEKKKKKRKGEKKVLWTSLILNAKSSFSCIKHKRPFLKNIKYDKLAELCKCVELNNAAIKTPAGQRLTLHILLLSPTR